MPSISKTLKRISRYRAKRKDKPFTKTKQHKKLEKRFNRRVSKRARMHKKKDMY